MFGVDINPNSVKICRLRLWIELLKNAYYKADGELETLPNIDINIKCGNSLISRFDLDTDLKDALKKSKLKIPEYKAAVQSYRNAKSKDEKWAMDSLIKEVKSGFQIEILSNDKRVLDLYKYKNELNALLNQQSLFELDKKAAKLKKDNVSKLETDITKLEKTIEEIRSNKIYENAFEWRFEFPEVLNDSGEYVGFDVVIGNPPYIFTRESISEQDKNYFNTNYKQTQFKINLYLLFVERSWQLMNKNASFTFITPNNWLTLETASDFRHFILTNAKDITIVNSKDNIFENAAVDTSILTFNKVGDEVIHIYEIEKGAFNYIKTTSPNSYLQNKKHLINYEQNELEEHANIFKKISNCSEVLEAIAEVRNGIQAYTVGEGTPALTEDMKKQRVYHSNYKQDDTWFKYVDGIDVCRYELGWSGQYVKYGNNLSRPRKFEYFVNDRLLVRQIPAKPPYSILACFVNDVIVNDNNSMIVVNPNSFYSLKYLLAILNSRLMSFWFIHTYGKLQRKVFPQFKVKELRDFPIKVIDFNNSNDVAIHNKLVSYVDNINITDASFTESNKEIDSLIYKLYGITDDEVKLIESY